MIIDGRKLAAERTEELKVERAKHGALSLGVVIATTDAVTHSYVSIKKKAATALNIDVVEYRLQNDATLEDIMSKTKEAGMHDGVILQLPLPSHVDVDVAKNAISANVDVDVLSDSAFELFKMGAYPPVPPVPAAMHYVLKRNDIDPKGKRVVVVGKGRLVGKPADVLFRHLGSDVVTLGRGDDVPAHTRTADIIVLGTGVSGLLKPDMMKEGVVILDGGTSELGGKVVGDADPSCAEKASLFTPVPGGVGPIAVVEIFANLLALKKATY